MAFSPGDVNFNTPPAAEFRIIWSLDQRPSEHARDVAFEQVHAACAMDGRLSRAETGGFDQRSRGLVDQPA